VLSANGKIVLLAVLILLGSLVLSGCVTVGEYERLKAERDQALSDADSKNRQLEELDASKRLYEEKALALEDEIGRYREHSAQADKIIEDLKTQLASQKPTTTGEKSVMDGVEIFVSEKQDAGIRLSDEILFDSGKTSIKSAGKQALDWVISQLKQRNCNIEVVGHTDTDPVVKTKKQYPYGNIQLSMMRAVVVMDYLKKNGIREDRMSVSGFGPNKPVAPNDTATNKKKNRRVEIILHD